MSSQYKEPLKTFFPSVTAHMLQNAKNVTIGALHVSSLRNKIGAVQELITPHLTTFKSATVKIFSTDESKTEVFFTKLIS